MRFPTFKFERKYLAQGYDFVVGCDEVGRGPLAGPVVAVACVLDPASIGTRRSKNKWYARIRDSKTVSEKERQILAEKIKAHAPAYGIGVASEGRIDRINIHNASLEAMRLAVINLIRQSETSPRKILLLIDGRFVIPKIFIDGIEVAQRTVVSGDAHVLSIAAASIVAKVHRDAMMRKFDREYPEYGFGRHKGYGTKEHFKAIRTFGLTSAHRKSFVKNHVEDEAGLPVEALT